MSDASSGILHYKDGELKQIFKSEDQHYYSDTLAGVAHTLWAYRDTLYVGVSTGVWKESIETGEGEMTPWKEIRGDWVYSRRIRGQHYNDIFVVGNNMAMAHYNGKSWRSFSNIFGTKATYLSVDFKDNVVCAVGGTDGYQGIVVIGKR